MAEFASWQRDCLLLVLLGCSNLLPIVGRLVLGDRLAFPVDCGARWRGRPLLGPHKTWRGLVLSVIGTAAAGAFMSLDWTAGAGLASLSMAGDLASSFVKRRLGLESGQKAVGLDQGLESFLPLWIMKGYFGLEWWEIVLLVLVFSVLGIAFSPLLYRLGIRRNPH